MKLTKSDIAYIRYDLKKKGIVYSGLYEELVDHVCCEVEVIVNSGVPFKKAYEMLLLQLEEDQLITIQHKTIQSENYNTIMLLKNNMKIMLRNMVKNRSHSLINIGGLVLGFLCFIVITIYVTHELNFDKQFKNSKNIYRITASSTVGGNTNHIPTSFPTIGPALKDRFEDLQSYVRIINYKYTRFIPTFTHDDNTFYEEKVIFADSLFFQLFDFPFAEGDPTTAMAHPTSVVITERVAKKYFGNESALGKRLLFNNKTDLEITGIIKDIPSNTHLQFDFLIPMSGIQYSDTFSRARLERWDTDWFWTYFVIPDKNSLSRIVAGIDKLTDEHIPDLKHENQAKFYLQALEDVHLKSDFDYNTDLVENGNSINLYIFASIGIIVLLISGINFINITIALATRRYKEIGISKVLGALRSQLRTQFISESVITCLVAVFIAFLVLQLTLPVFSELFGVNLQISFYKDFGLIFSIVGFAIALGLFSGFYPAVFVSSLEPQRVLKGVWKSGTGGAQFRKILVGLQIAISIFLVIGTIVIFKQLNFIQNKALGFDKEHVIMLNARGTAITKKYHAVKHKLESESSIMSVSSVSEPVGREVQFMTFQLEGYEDDQFIKILNVTYDFAKTMGLEIVQGRDFSREFVTDSTSGFIINEAAARAYKWSDPIGKAIKHPFPQAPQGKVIGVVKDFNFEPLHKKIDPLVIWFGRPNWYVAVKIKPGNIANTLALIEKTWTEYEPDKPFSYQFLDQSIQKVYEKEQRVSKVFLVFSVLSIITASLGLFGLVSFIAKQRLVEIGIRKVMGASVNNILTLIAKDYLLLMLIAFVVAAPLTYFIMNIWLNKFAFRIEWNGLYFATGLIMVMTIVTCTVLARSFSAAKSNPVKVLRNE